MAGVVSGQYGSNLTPFLHAKINGGIRLLMEAYFSAVTADGCEVMDEEWDQLLILDGCRTDTFRQCNWIEGNLETRVSQGSSTPGFLKRNFDGRTYPDTVYVTANPIHRVSDWCDVDLDSVFHQVIDVWEDEWDDELGTVPPDAMADATRVAYDRHSGCRLIAHFVQPHYPFIGPTGQDLEHSGIMGKQRIENGSSDQGNLTVWDVLESGEVTAQRVWQAYEENLTLVLRSIEGLVAELDGTTVITSDHGNHFGEYARPFPVKLYGHPEDIRTSELVEVPWLTVRNEPA